MLSLGWYFFYFWVPWFLSTSIHIVDMPWFTIMFFFLSGFSSQILTIHRTGQGKRGDYLLFHSTTSTRSRTSRHLFATLHVKWLSRIFNRKACVWQTATRWDLPPYRITISVIEWWCNACLFTWWIDTRFLLQRFEIGNRWISTRIDYHPCITSEPTNQVCYVVLKRVIILSLTSPTAFYGLRNIVS